MMMLNSIVNLNNAMFQSEILSIRHSLVEDSHEGRSDAERETLVDFHHP